MKIRKVDKRILIFTALLVAFFTLTFETQKYFLINTTDSVEKGIYFIDRKSEITTGEYVGFFVPDEMKKMVLERGYLSNDIPLIKKVRATAGESFCINDDRSFLINSVKIGESQTADSKGRPLPKLRGCFEVPANSFVVVGQGANSFDSRYFGTISEDKIIGKMKMIFPFSFSKKGSDSFLRRNQQTSLFSSPYPLGFVEGDVPFAGWHSPEFLPLDNCDVAGRQDKALPAIFYNVLKSKEKNAGTGKRCRHAIDLSI